MLGSAGAPLLLCPRRAPSAPDCDEERPFDGMEVTSEYRAMHTGAEVLDDETFLGRFEAGTFPLEQWHHREHIKAAYLYLRAHAFELALERMRTGIRALNAA